MHGTNALQKVRRRKRNIDVLHQVEQRRPEPAHTTMHGGPSNKRLARHNQTEALPGAALSRQGLPRQGSARRAWVSASKRLPIKAGDPSPATARRPEAGASARVRGLHWGA
jgi:hypothetical protein